MAVREEGSKGHSVTKKEERDIPSPILIGNFFEVTFPPAPLSNMAFYKTNIDRLCMSSFITEFRIYKKF